MLIISHHGFKQWRPWFPPDLPWFRSISSDFQWFPLICYGFLIHFLLNLQVIPWNAPRRSRVWHLGGGGKRQWGGPLDAGRVVFRPGLGSKILGCLGVGQIDPGKLHTSIYVIYIYLYLFIFTYLHIYIFTYIHIYICICICICICVCICICISYIYIWVCVYMYMYMYMYMYKLYIHMGVCVSKF